jgi:hypothetical protein
MSILGDDIFLDHWIGIASNVGENIYVFNLERRLQYYCRMSSRRSNMMFCKHSGKSYYVACSTSIAMIQLPFNIESMSNGTTSCYFSRK